MRILAVVVSLIAVIASANAALADQRVALVVGNGTYKNLPNLENPADDAHAMAALLKGVGFVVVEGTDLTRDKMTERLLEFGKKAQGADLAVFFYAGRNIAIGGSNYLLPVDADIRSEMDVKLGSGINIDLTLDQTMSAAKVKLVFLDISRNDPFGPSARTNSPIRDIATAQLKPGENTLMAFATSPGAQAIEVPKGAHSPFTEALLANIAQPGVEIQEAMTRVRAQVNEATNKAQLPWDHSFLLGKVYLNPTEAQKKTGK